MEHVKKIKGKKKKKVNFPSTQLEIGWSWNLKFHRTHFRIMSTDRKLARDRWRCQRPLWALSDSNGLQAFPAIMFPTTRIAKVNLRFIFFYILSSFAETIIILFVLLGTFVLWRVYDVGRKLKSLRFLKWNYSII